MKDLSVQVVSWQKHPETRFKEEDNRQEVVCMFYLLTLCRQYVVKFLKSKQIILNIESNIYLNTLQLSDVIK